MVATYGQRQRVRMERVFSRDDRSRRMPLEQIPFSDGHQWHSASLRHFHYRFDVHLLGLLRRMDYLD